ncbi:DUF6400 family protein [Streptomyces europaeiscabiei]|uniref:DUF6400 family protein n=1 Tax=Streptomyces europaeiscabiei TaxID=146819 RepID=A0AAJ2PJV5_9ACTN|nr:MULTISPECIES: DUF6400 family protein [Streptomyces]KFG00837.1 hypothetical protein IQ62_11150 [Streptomyces scabiei]MDX3128513.1 DUF6400 family protein [Streptomyces europaeiscabiei]
MSHHGRAFPGEPDEPVAASDPAADRPDASPTIDLVVDLSSHELLRRAHVLDALGADWDPIAALRGEEAAYELLYSGLSAEQQRVYDELVSAGVLPGGGGGHAAA